MTRQPDLFGTPPPPKTKQWQDIVSIQATATKSSRLAVLLETPDIPPKSAWVPVPPVTPDPDHDGFFLIPRKMAIEKGLM